ncbi:MAG: Asp-tRNA(Asn)/Glu-tRNA(Gln) amidotransferase GatCAB subunit A, partial [Fibrobacter sp.]|uniref:amidase n=1 Tax=Fibrobacter sp. TaxID=35828 RepID=UPI001B1DC2E2
MQTIQELQAQLESGSTTAEKLAQASLEKIESTKNLNAYISVLNERALAKAKESDKRRAEGKSLGALDGIPVAVKDNMCLEGTRTTAASKILENFVAPYTATAVEKLEAAGAIIVGKTNMDEFAMGSSNETSYFGPVKNPLDESRVPGG